MVYPKVYCIKCQAEPDPTDVRWRLEIDDLWAHEHDYHWYVAIMTVSTLIRLRLIYSEGLGL